MNTLIDGVDPEYDWSGVRFDVNIEVKDPATGELAVHSAIVGQPEVTLSIYESALLKDYSSGRITFIEPDDETEPGMSVAAGRVGSPIKNEQQRKDKPKWQSAQSTLTSTIRKSTIPTEGGLTVLTSPTRTHTGRATPSRLTSGRPTGS